MASSRQGVIYSLCFSLGWYYYLWLQNVALSLAECFWQKEEVVKENGRAEARGWFYYVKRAACQCPLGVIIATENLEPLPGVGWVTLRKTGDKADHLAEVKDYQKLQGLLCSQTGLQVAL